MKRINAKIWLAALAGVAAAAFFSCSREAVEPGVDEEAPVAGDGEVRTVNFRAVSTGTRARFGEAEDGVRPTLWTDNDSELKLSLNYGSAVKADISPSEDHVTALFSADVSFAGVSGPYTFYAVSPSSSAKALSPSREAWKVSIPCEQTPTASSPDENAIIIAASSASFATASNIRDIDMYFHHLTSYARVSLANFTLGQDEELEAVEFTFTTPVVGDWYWKCTEGENGHELIDYGTSSTVKVITSSPSNIWFGCAPVSVSGEMLVVHAYTSAGVYEQMIQFPEGRKFEAGRVAVFSVDMAGVEPVGAGSTSTDFELVTDASTLSAGNEVIIANIDGDKALGAFSDNIRRAVAITVSNDVITSVGDASILTLSAGSSSGTWAFHDGDGYIATSTSRNKISLSSTIDATSSWIVSIVGGEATVLAKSGTYKYLCYNSGSPRFSGYSSISNQIEKVVIYRRGVHSSGDVTVDPLLDNSVYGCWLGAGYEWEYNPGTDQMTRSYNSAGVLTCTLINPDNVEELEISGYKKSYVKGDNVRLTVAWRRGSTSVLSNSYSMTLVKEDGPKVWLSDGRGKGFIIKK
ncbi:MAG: hypothetical protein IKP46_04665 [Bacteroidales bacterium]|nr:hypothetical protein [Bacteroidales bacterium]